jgi:hypothetical protein
MLWVKRRVETYAIDRLIQNDSKITMIRTRAKKQKPIRIHSSLDVETHQRLTALAKRDKSSVARVIKLAVIEFLDKHQPNKGASDNGDQVR